MLTSHHACHSRTSTREYDYLGPVPECLRAATGQHLSQPAGSPLRLLLGDGYTEEQLRIKGQGLDPCLPNGTEDTFCRYMERIYLRRMSQG